MRINRKKFAHLLIDKDMSVKEVAEKVGYHADHNQHKTGEKMY